MKIKQLAKSASFLLVAGFISFTIPSCSSEEEIIILQDVKVNSESFNLAEDGSTTIEVKVVPENTPIAKAVLSTSLFNESGVFEVTRLTPKGNGVWQIAAKVKDFSRIQNGQDVILSVYQEDNMYIQTTLKINDPYSIEGKYTPVHPQAFTFYSAEDGKLMAIFIIYTAIVNHNFLKIGSITNIISLAAASLPFALGVAGCIVLTGTDLSGGRVVGLSAALSAALLQKTDLARRMFSWMPNIPTWAGICIAILAVIAIGAIIGFVNGFFVAKFKLHPFIVTLATQLITYGLILVFFMLNDNNGQPLSGLSDGYSSFIKGKMISIGAVSLPWYVLYAIILLAITWFLWNKTTFGKNMFAVGSNAEAANVSGVNVFRTTVLVHTFAGVMYGLTGFIEGARISSITQSTGLNYECDAIAACVIGGVSFVGGTGKISGIVLGVLILRIIFAALTFLAIDSSLQYIIKGLIILVACSLDMRKYLVKK